jgi:hypothetical protein
LPTLLRRSAVASALIALLVTSCSPADTRLRGNVPEGDGATSEGRSGGSGFTGDAQSASDTSASDTSASDTSTSDTNAADGLAPAADAAIDGSVEPKDSSAPGTDAGADASGHEAGQTAVPCRITS